MNCDAVAYILGTWALFSVVLNIISVTSLRQGLKHVSDDDKYTK